MRVAQTTQCILFKVFPKSSIPTVIISNLNGVFELFQTVRAILKVNKSVNIGLLLFTYSNSPLVLLKAGPRFDEVSVSATTTKTTLDSYVDDSKISLSFLTQII